jgi:hypothetical protein
VDGQVLDESKEGGFRLEEVFGGHRGGESGRCVAGGDVKKKKKKERRERTTNKKKNKKKDNIFTNDVCWT